MSKKEVTAKTKFEEYFDARRNSDAFQEAVDEVVSGGYKPAEKSGPDDPTFKLSLYADDSWDFGPEGDKIQFKADVEGARELAAAYALYAWKVTKKGGEPSPFKRPTAKGWA